MARERNGKGLCFFLAYKRSNVFSSAERRLSNGMEFGTGAWRIKEMWS